jgi:hypothetical protein
MKSKKWVGVHARCSESLHDSINERAKAEGKKTSKLIVQILENGIGKEVISVDVLPLIQELKALRLSLVPIGSNMNQLALTFNTQQFISRDQLQINHKDLVAELKKIIISIRSIESELYRGNR